MSSDEATRVSIIIPTYNRWPRVCDAVDSLLAQTVSVTPIVVDDCSTDGSADKLSDAYGSSIKLIRQPENKEKSAARNRGIEEARTEFLCFLDSDDTFLPDGIERLLGVYDADPTFRGVSYGACTVGGEVEIPPDELPEGTVLLRYLEKPFLHTMSFMVRKAALLEAGLYREDLHNLEDVELFIRLMARMPFKPCGAVVSAISKQADSASANFDKIADQGVRVLDHLKSDSVAMEAMGEGFRLIQRKVYHELSRALYKAGRYADYCALYREISSAFPADFGGGRYRQRYWASRLRGLFQ